MNTKASAIESQLMHWAQIMNERRNQGLTNKEYCRQKGICEQTYYYWQRKLREEEGLKAERENVSEGFLGARFAEVRISVPQMSTIESESKTVSLCIEVLGMRISADTSYPVVKLAELLREIKKLC